jgi:hypothetical protein
MLIQHAGPCMSFEWRRIKGMANPEETRVPVRKWPKDR